MLKLIERIFESFLWKTRLVILLPVIFSLIGASGLFILGSYEIFHSIQNMLPLDDHGHNVEAVLIGVIGGVDLYLIGIVFLLFSFGIYELFISKIDAAKNEEAESILDIGSLDELKNKILKVVIMVLIVSFFKNIIQMKFSTALEMVYFGISIAMLAAAVYLIRKEDEKTDKHGEKK